VSRFYKWAIQQPVTRRNDHSGYCKQHCFFDWDKNG